jgi:hypothetical protein
MQNLIGRIPVLICCLSISMGAVVAAPGAEQNNLAKSYRVIFNCDGTAVAKDAGGDFDQWIDNIFGPLENSHVDVLFWCDGAGGNTANYESKVLERTGARAGEPRTYINDWIAAGKDPPKIVVREAHQRGLDVYYSFRVNDIHDSFTPDELPTFKVENPDWMLGEQNYDGVTSFPTALNFAIPEVRDLKFRVVEEIFQKYDFDGLEVDFLRTTPYFLPGTEAQNAHFLTEFLQRIRNFLNTRGEERGRPIPLAVRVGESFRVCELNGFEVQTWIEQDLCDMIILGSGVMDIEVEAFKHLAAKHGMPVYPCLYGWPSKYIPIPAELATGLALNYWAQGADGIYLFNWYPHNKKITKFSRPYMTGLMKQMGDPEALRASQKHMMFPADRGRPQPCYQYNWLHCVLPEAMPVDKPLRAAIRTFENFPADARLTLQLQVDNLQAHDEIAVHLNGQPVAGWQRDGSDRLRAAVAPELIQQGSNQVDMQLTRQSSASESPRTVTALELHAARD